MRLRLWIAIAATIAAASTAVADPWRTTIEVVLRKKPGERQAAIAKLPANTTVVIEKEEGRWVRVRAGKLAGYLTRTTIADVAAVPTTPPIGSTTPAEPTHPKGPANRWSEERVKATRSGTTGLFVAVTAPSSSLFGEPRGSSAKLVAVDRGTRLAVIDAANPAWIHVRDGSGREAWIARSDVDNGLAGTLSEPRDAIAAPVVALPAATGAIAIRAGAGVGYRSVGMDFTSNGAAGLANYLVSADAAAANADVDVVARIARLRIGFEARAQVSTSSPGSGIEYLGPSRAGGKIPFSTFAVDGGVRVALRRRVFELAVRGGVHYDAFIAKDVENAGRLPREQLYGGTIGGRVEIAPPTSRVTVGLRVDALVLGTRDQTPGLEDGAASSAHAVWAGASVRIAIRRHLAAVAGYDFTRATTSWTGMSVRTPGVTQAHRVDSSQTVQLGLSAEL